MSFALSVTVYIFILNLHWRICNSICSYYLCIALRSQQRQRDSELSVGADEGTHELRQIMKNYLEENNGTFGSFEVNLESVQFSGMLNLMDLS